MELLKSSMSKEQEDHVVNLINMVSEYVRENVPLDSTIVMQGLALNIQCYILSKCDHNTAMHIARYITTVKPHPDKKMRLAIDSVLSGKAEQMFAIFDKQFQPSTDQ